MGQGMASKWSWISSPNGLVCVSRTGVHLRPDRLPGREILISGRGLRREDWPSSALWARPPGKLLDLTGITFFFLFFFLTRTILLGCWRWTVFMIGRKVG